MNLKIFGACAPTSCLNAPATRNNIAFNFINTAAMVHLRASINANHGRNAGRAERHAFDSQVVQHAARCFRRQPTTNCLGAALRRRSGSGAKCKCTDTVDMEDSARA